MSALSNIKQKNFGFLPIVFVSKDENLTKAHVRYLEGRLISEALQVGRFKLENSQASGSKLPESDREDMEVFLYRIRQLLPVLGSEIFVPIAPQQTASKQSVGPLVCRIKGAQALGQRTPDGFVVFRGSTAVLQERPATLKRQPYLVEQRKRLLDEGILAEQNGFYVFTKDAEFSSPSAAGICGLGAEQTV